MVHEWVQINQAGYETTGYPEISVMLCIDLAWTLSHCFSFNIKPNSSPDVQTT